MTPEQAAEVVRTVDGAMASARDAMLDALIARLLSPSKLGWRDATKEAPPRDVMVLAVDEYDGVGFFTYLGENGQSSRRLPNPQACGYWMTHAGVRSVNTYESKKSIRWWMSVPLAPVSP